MMRRNRSRAAALKFLFHLFAALPLPVAHGLGAAIGALLFVIPNRRRRIAETNLRLCFPGLGATERRRLLRRGLVETGKAFAEVAALWTRSEKRLRRLVRRVSGEDRLQELIRQGRGVIIAAPHLGAWELVGLYCSLRYPMTSLYRPPPVSEMGDLMRRARERFSARLVPTDQTGVRALYKALDRGEMIGILPDQVPAAGSGVFAPFFGVPAATMVLLSRLAIKTGAPVVFAWAERLSCGRGFHLHFLPAPGPIGQGDLESSAAVVNAMVESCVRTAPAQYHWVYKRFRARPAGEKSVY
jgi:KDO2-lipid IV(A) lauroyltransferase